MKRIIPPIIIGSMAVGAGFGAYVWHWQHRPHVLEVYCFALDKSAGSAGNLAVFIRTPNGHTILVDGGKSDSIIQALTSVMPFYRRTIDTIISANPDDSHVTGLADVVSRYRVGQIIEPLSDESATSSAYLEFENRIAAGKIERREVSSGDQIDFGDSDLSVKVLFPAASADFAFSKTNLPVIAFSVRYGSTTLLFGGDISKTEQKYLGDEIASSTGLSLFLNNFPAYPAGSLLILPHAENSGVPDQNFFDQLNPRKVVVLKKPQTSGVPKKPASSAVPTKSKPKKPPKPPFSILDIPGISVVNLAAEGDTEFISDGADFLEEKLK